MPPRSRCQGKEWCCWTVFLTRAMWAPSRGLLLHSVRYGKQAVPSVTFVAVHTVVVYLTLSVLLSPGWDGLVVLPGTADPFNGKAVMAGMGATFSLPWLDATYEEVSTAVSQSSMHGDTANAWHPLVADSGAGVSLSDMSCPSDRNILLVLGNETHGPSQDIIEACASSVTQVVTIPTADTIESLNVSAAAAILMHGLRNL